jgi:hypothetical protein
MVDNVVNALSLLDERIILADTALVELVVWAVPEPVPGSSHGFKYRLALVASGACVVRYDNEAGKGDHKHIGEVETPYRFEGLAPLQDSFWKDVEQWLKLNSGR